MFAFGWFSPKSDGACRALRLALLLPLALMCRAVVEPELLGLTFRDPDDAMRLVQIRDLVAGQNWFDLSQARLDPPNSVPTHWSRIADVPIAAIIFLVRPFLGPGLAEKTALLIWPPLLFTAFAFMVASIARRLGGSNAMPAAILLGLSAGIVAQFVPGRIDHHALQATIAGAAFACALRREDPRFARLTGVFTGLAVAVGLETAAVLGTIGLFFASDLLLDRDRRGSAVAYTTGTSLTLVLAFVVTTHPSQYWLSGCDGPTGTIVLSALVAMLALRLCAMLLPKTSLAWRLAGLATAGVVTVAMMLRVEPSCLRGLAGAANEEIVPAWMTMTDELQSLAATAVNSPGTALQFTVLPLLGLLGAAWIAHHDPLHRRAALETFACLALLTLIGFVAVRGFTLANIIAVGPTAAASTMLLRARGPASIPPALKSMIFATLICFASYGAAFLPAHRVEAAPLSLHTVAVPSSQPASGSPQPTDALCVSQPTYQRLASLPKGLVLGPIWTGPRVLVWTHHDVMSSPHHRFRRGNEFAEAAIRATVEEANTAIQDRGIDYVVLCRSFPALSPFIEALKNNPPDWLERKSDPNDDLLVFRVRKQRH